MTTRSSITARAICARRRRRSSAPPRESGIAGDDRRHQPSPTRSPRADRIVLPGVGAFADCRRGLAAVPGLEAALAEAVIGARPAVSRHLRRHAADGRARPRVRDGRGARLDRRRGRGDRAGRSRAARSRIWAGTSCVPRARIRCSTGSPAGTHTYFVHSYHFRPSPTPPTCSPTTDYGGRADRGGRPRQSGRHAISPGKEPGWRACG